MTLCVVSTESLFADHPVIRNDAWLVARGVRPMSLIDEDIELLTGDDAEAIQHNGSIMQQAVEELKDILASVTGASAELEPIPFAIPTMSDDPEHGGPAQWLTCGFAAYPRIVDMATWLWSDEPAYFPFSEILGLLFGYSPAAIQAFLDQHPDDDREAET